MPGRWRKWMAICKVEVMGQREMKRGDGDVKGNMNRQTQTKTKEDKEKKMIGYKMSHSTDEQME